MRKRSLLLFLSFLLLISGFSERVDASQFIDMPVKGHWSRPALETAVANGLLKGDGGRLKPKENLTRAEMAAVINRAFGVKEKASLERYVYVDSKDWFYKDMAQAVGMGTFQGYGDRLNPNKAITRQEAFIVIARALELDKSSKPPLGFKDLSQIDSWARGKVYALVNENYIQGSDGSLNPKGQISREEFAQVMHNILNYDEIKDKEDKEDKPSLEVEGEVLRLVNIERKKQGLKELKLGDKLSDVARLKSQDMADNSYFSHTSPTYGSPFDMMKRFNINYRAAGENIAMGHRSPEAVMTGWMNSPGHRANILNPNFGTLGVGYVAGNGSTYWTQMFTD